MSRSERPPTDLVAWLHDPRDDAGLALANEREGWTAHTYADLAGRAGRVAHLLRERGARPGDVVSLVLPTGIDFPAAFFGCLVAGVTPNPLAPPMRDGAGVATTEHLRALLDRAEPRLVVTNAMLEPRVRAAVDGAGGPEVVLAEDADTPWTEPIGCPDDVLMQFTSGSTGTPRPIRVSRANLEANIHATRDWLAMGRDDGTASWLPLHHDMGLIGCLLTPVLNQSPLWLMRPEQFLRRPMRWLERFGTGDAVLTSSSSFGYGYAARRARPDALAGLDFSGWRAAIVGAERIQARDLLALLRVLGPHGLAPTTFLPAYGLAEATLVVSGQSIRDVPRLVDLDWSGIDTGRPAPFTTTRLISELGDEATDWLVGCGTVRVGEVTIVDDDRAPVPPGTVGEIVVHGPCVALGVPDAGGPLHTGDAGFVHDDELFVLGRMGDSLKVRGRTVFVEDIETRLRSLAPLPADRFAVVAGAVGGEDVAIVVAEATDAPWAAEAAQLVRGALGRSVGVQVAIGSRGLIQRTSSGKPRRRLIWRAVVDGTESTTVLRLPAMATDVAADIS